ncbi:crotonobetainyl-CoA:carnitine CoA-transferase CaiB-like acyl-CoA transferase [Catenuloplanes nepalensis]|uniref:Crotonobetainyl-CoA:carnitine CoA-transferase CaiB-like acyl-CoA transferase n=1 Tax=Catenuloplanes nepalensis TaxID=587533 RepID=A0ABT9MNX3_9ACTN|nr:CoA transferase [Catenuloplanes nepalensis]MDP9793107.1 crotonobetainyl-CoA:carnitine CoA-transferase CaiB-like acyl-CoA transferase [Catenuloplanes nepalensis]
MHERPLDGVRVLDLTNVLAGPYCTYHLALLGAEVVKVEVPGRGDLARRLGPDPELNAAGLGASFLAQNAGKKSVELDLKHSTGREHFTELVTHADVLVENYRAGVLARLGFPWERLRALNPALVYCAITGFGQSGPMSQAPAYDQIIQGLSGMMSITGTPETAPLRVGFPVADTVGGLSAALAITAALAGRRHDGRGRFLDVSMLEASLSAMGWAVSNYVVSGTEPQPMGDQNATAAPSGTFTAADGPLNIAANRQEQFETLCRLVGREDLISHPHYAGREARKQHRARLNEELNVALRARPAADWERILPAAGVPAARILTVAQAVAADQVAGRGFFTDLPYPPGTPGAATARTDGALRVSGSGVLHDGEALTPPSAPPVLGEHNDSLPELLARWREADRRHERPRAGSAQS